MEISLQLREQLLAWGGAVKISGPAPDVYVIYPDAENGPTAFELSRATAGMAGLWTRQASAVDAAVFAQKQYGFNTLITVFDGGDGWFAVKGL